MFNSLKCLATVSFTIITYLFVYVVLICLVLYLKKIILLKMIVLCY